jgi:SAM-dependent methyltransferase
MGARRSLIDQLTAPRLGTPAALAPDEPANHERPSEANDRLWRGNHVARYANRSLRPVEVVLLARYSEALSGRVLEVGCGGGRILGYLVALGGEVHGVDISPAMVEYCRRTYPEADVRVGDLMRLSDAVAGPLDAVFAPDNVLDFVDAQQRREALDAIRSLLAPDGLLIFCSHNLAAADGPPPPVSAGMGASSEGGALHRLAHMSAASVATRIAHLPRQRRNRKRLRPLEVRHADYAILNDIEGDYGAMHYYVRHAVQARQLTEAGYTLLECLEAEGTRVPEGQDGTSSWLHYVARPA